MKVGTKSVLFGAHCFFIHPIFLFIAWCKLYGFPFDPRLWVAFFVHDLGYIGKPNMDGKEGEAHVELGAKIMGFLFGKEWADFSKYHSRFYAKNDNVKPSRLCVADKLAICLEPAWFYLLRVNLSGEIKEYMRLAGKSKYKGESLNRDEYMNLDTGTQMGWFTSMVSYMKRWVDEHKDGKEDTWTPKSCGVLGK
ncbi:hypothetical protein M2451_003335 [Dysgonomonas sp. PFB1-18]|uniref:hypothetical protein n=1 Tax=unclassified Dysgonomonas TaxID=2630389 RepID=UPI0024736CA1|nr:MULTISPECIES: hypothetical protein [unclassified Dysgonomonas]MDH6310575.1 hypothetical protein [Dysgonomonas sp. PF1-14]MDH6340425.1 hypothetical protein [Dysgonomonas sp. PF1-16]MDH6381995.1 hypothetical protein [Dysgonomonas sp. PFB1-18]MDH6399396.1 hypothetical protein [Dysgonomonas sp. PF1-23]